MQMVRRNFLTFVPGIPRSVRLLSYECATVKRIVLKNPSITSLSNMIPFFGLRTLQI